MAPVDDADARLDARRAAEAEIALLAVALEAQVREVGRARVDLRRLGGATELAQQRALPVPLLGERHRVLRLALREDLLAEPLEVLQDRRLVGPRRGALRVEHLGDAREERELLFDDGVQQDLLRENGEGG